MKPCHRHTLFSLVLASGYSCLPGALAADKTQIDEVERAIARMWADRKSIVCRFTEVRNPGVQAGYIIRIEGTREIIRDGGQSKSRNESVEFAVVSAGANEQVKELKRSMVICDGTYRIRHVTGQETAERAPADTCENPLEGFRWLRRTHDLVPQPAEKFNEEPVTVLAARAPGVPVNEWLLYYRKDGVLVKQVRLDIKGKHPQTTITYLDIKLDETVDPERFVFTPPQGVTVKDVESLKAPKPEKKGD